MGRAAGPRLLTALLCVSFAGSLGERDPTENFPHLTNVSVSVEHLCTLIWTWNPPERTAESCSPLYFSYVDKKNEKECSINAYRETTVALNEKVCIQVRSQCNCNQSESSNELVKCCTPTPRGDPETAVRDLHCIWHSLKSMNCSWLPGRKAPPDADYTLHYWYSGLEVNHQCTDLSVRGELIACSFTYFPNQSGEVQIMVNDSSGKVRPFYQVVTATSFVKPDPPLITNLSKTNDSVYVEWVDPVHFPRGCLEYQVETRDSLSREWKHRKVVNPEDVCQTLLATQEPQEDSQVTNCFKLFTFHPGTVLTIRIRAKTRNICYDSDIWSEWSEEKSIGEKEDYTFYIIILLTIPVIITVAIIVLLLYLKRLKIIIFPPIPDPGKIFKEMFGEQNDNTLHWRKYDIHEKQMKEETDSVVLIENQKTSS
ncbi:interleukin-13 receptor subunit alpha-1 [Tachyglossus aculeatus]|uniref:interleukin-13 receptor subunit alpha-1 n=1 Tax=Tachyglossus aculeatus TaxID=9261 RepID=UPI0018F3AFB8|nr:interleukin-13 receptor subunit alpha-1 [Tachyglossus aculeatus]